MRPSDFQSPEAGYIYRSREGHDTFVPAPLPPNVSYDAEVALALSRADTVLSELSGVGRHLPIPHLLIAPYLRQEAVLSSRIEGTQTSLSDVLLDEVDAGDQTAASEADRQEVRNYVHALEDGLASLSSGRLLTLNMVRDLHGILMCRVRGEFSSPGKFRTMQNWITGSQGSRIEQAVYIPPAPELLLECLTDWERFLHVEGTMPDLVQCALLHEQFEAIHPFIDGNGRMGRLLVTLFLIQRGRLSQPLLYLSAYIERNKQDYYDLLQAVRTRGDWRSWILFFLAGVEETARAAVKQTTQLIDLREAFRDHLTQARKPRALELVDHLFVNPYITVPRAQKILDVSTPTARSAIDVLEQGRIVTTLPGRTWRRLYLCEPILDAIGGRPTPIRN